MKKLIFLFLFTICFISKNFAQWQWVKAGNLAFSWDEGNGVATDAAGNCYVIGSYSSHSIQFGSFTFPNASTGSDDVFIVKYSPAGIPLWAQRAGGTNYDYGMAVAIDTAGNVLITGHYYSSSIIFGTDTLINTLGGGTDIYTVKFSPSGTVLWARSGGGMGFDESATVCTDLSGNVYVAGEFYSSSMTFGSQTINNSGTDTLDMFILKYDAAGNVAWLKGAGGTSNDAISGITCDKTGNVFATGSSGSPVCDFGAISITNPGIYGYNDAFTVKYNSAGTALWGRTGQGSIFEDGEGIDTDTLGNVYVTGTFSSSYIVFGSDTLFNAHTAGGPGDVFTVKYDNTGNELWARTLGGIFIENGSGIAVDANGNAFITGSFQTGFLHFGPCTLANTGTDDAFVAMYDTNGNEIGIYGAGGMGSDKSFGIAVDPAGEIYITGEFYSNSISGGTYSVVNSGGGYSDMFVAKLLTLDVGIDENTLDENAIVVFPNPSSGDLTLITKENKISSVSVLNTLGKIVLSFSDSDHERKIDLNGFAKGIYFLQVFIDNNVLYKKIIIQ